MTLHDLFTAAASYDSATTVSEGTGAPVGFRSPENPLNVVADKKVALLPTHAHAFILADKYMIDGLDELALQYLEQTAERYPHAVMTGYFPKGGKGGV